MIQTIISQYKNSKHMRWNGQVQRRQFHDFSVWQCYSKLTGRWTRISGPLAQVLQKYPEHFTLILIAVPYFVKREKRYEHVFRNYQ